MNISEFKSLITEHWVPPVITGVFGLLVGLSISLFDAEISDNRYFLEKQATTADRVAMQFSKYTENWRRIVSLKNYVASENRKPTPQEFDLLKKYVIARDSAKDSLYSALDASQLYFEENTSNLSVHFKEWDVQQSTKLTNELPAISEWQSRKRRILLAMRKELRDD